jgi:hypothetical protein
MSASTKIDHLIARFDAVNAEAIAFVETCPDAQWRATCPAERWPAAVVAHHIAVVHQEFMPLVRAFAGDETFSPSSSMDDVDRTNAEHALAFAAVGKRETAEALRASGAALAAALHAIAEDALGRTAGHIRRPRDERRPGHRMDPHRSRPIPPRQPPRRDRSVMHSV